MDTITLFRSARLTGQPPYPGARALYSALLGPRRGPVQLAADLQDWARHAVAPWVLSHAGHPVGVAGFRIGFGEEGLDLSFHFLPDVAGQGLASEFVQAALDHASDTLREDRFFAQVPTGDEAARRVLEKAGFRTERRMPGAQVMRLRLSPRRAYAAAGLNVTGSPAGATLPWGAP
jgi:RimJ/RimL family protein N-acetyltransferase